MKSYVFIKNTLILTVTALILRSAGIFLRVWMANKIGSEGIGLYQLIFSVYMLVSAFATAGVCTAVTRLVAENFDKGKQAQKRIFKISAWLVTIIAVISAIIVYFLSEVIATDILKDFRAQKAIKILSFSLPFMGISSCVRGYFTAKRKMTVPSISQIIEQAVRIAIIFLLLAKTRDKGLEFSAATILFADTVAEAVSCLISYLCYLKDIKSEPEKGGGLSGILSEILRISVPITLGKYLATALKTAENIIVPNMLAMFFGSRKTALSLFGDLRGMAIPLMFFPSSFLMSVSTLLIPEMSEDLAQNREVAVGYKASKTVNITLKASVFIATVFFVCAYDLSDLIYHSKEVGFIIRVLSPIIPFMYLESVIDGINKGLDQQNYTLLFNVIDSVFRIIVILTLVPKFGLVGFLGLMIVSNIITSMSNFYRVKVTAKIRVDIKNSVLKPLSSAAVTLIIAKLFLPTRTIGFLPTALKVLAVCAVFGVAFIIQKGYKEKPFRIN